MGASRWQRRPWQPVVTALAVGAVALGATRTSAAPRRSAAVSRPGPSLTVMGYASCTPNATGAASETRTAGAEAPQINLSFTASASAATAAMQRLAGDLSTATARLRALGVRSTSIQALTAPSLSYDPASAQYQAGNALQVTVASLRASASLLDRLQLDALPDLNSMWVNVFSSEAAAPAPTVTGTRKAYAQAFTEAAQSAQAMAAADGLHLGRQLRITEGAQQEGGGTDCSESGAPAGSATAQLAGPGQSQVIAVTVTYATVQESGNGGAG